MSTARFLPAARLELLAEVIYYNNAQVGLGSRFASAIEEATARALAFPGAGAPTRGNARRVIVKDFPFSLVYREEPSGNRSLRYRPPRTTTLLLGVTPTCALTLVRADAREREWSARNGVAVHALSRAPLNKSLGAKVKRIGIPRDDSRSVPDRPWGRLKERQRLRREARRRARRQA